ncbi:RNA 2',3'-cyclic phosphodiesterase [Halomonas huangheensis]|uniref:RNA 2',3'-cyclic phosphodiesterase n=1 Tax=Halomonas huangheensis TaxID=1178482 RepID=W1N5Y3_9GAMM|nr:RNA 2',3'-cyclic phosphodiesterase [Halomonas huangheensis]ALM54371.1 hypothetical protein AR456_20425 [Halomonas huangheensis]ERL50933.1 hypothetical protein BJB45_20270 [Halomonas huangheensis]
MRLFLALSPPDDLRQRLGTLADSLHDECGGRRVPDANLHLTLAFLGEQSAEQAQQLEAWLQQMQVAAGDIRLDHCGHFRRPGIVWIGPRHTPSPLKLLHADVSHALKHMGIATHPSEHFRPHVTLLRNANAPVTTMPVQTLHWSYNQIQLIQSTLNTSGSHYRCLASTTVR